MLFEEAGCKVLVATSGAEALHLFASQSRRFGASRLLDYDMLGIDGDVVAEHMSGWPSVAASTPCRTCGNNAVSTEGLRILRKPVNR